MRILMTTTLAAPVAVTLSTGGTAAAEELKFPDKCKSYMAMSGDMMQGQEMRKMDISNMPDHQKESMEGMKSMDIKMMQGMMKKDPNVAFNCGMIAHYMGAISMAETELKHGKDKASKARAQQIIDAQKKEIREMTAWVDKHVK